MAESTVHQGSRAQPAEQACGEHAALQDGGVKLLLRQLVDSTSAIIALMEQGNGSEALVLLDERNSAFQAVREAVDNLHQSGNEGRLDDETIALLADAAEAHRQLERATDGARVALRRELAGNVRGTSAGTAYGRASGPGQQRRLDARR